MEDITTTLPLVATLTCSLSWGIVKNTTLISFIVNDMKENNAKGMMSRVRCGGQKTALQNPTRLSEKLFMGSVVVVSFLCCYFMEPKGTFSVVFFQVRQYLHLGIPPAKMILGVPWYGYR